MFFTVMALSVNSVYLLDIFFEIIIVGRKRKGIS